MHSEMHLHCVHLAVDMNLTIYIPCSVLQQNVNKVNCQNKLHSDYDEPLGQYNVKGCSTIFHRKFHLLEF